MFSSYLHHKKTAYVSGVNLNIPMDIISEKSIDFLGIREADITMIAWNNQMEIGVALALHKKVITVNATGENAEHPNIINCTSWNTAVQHLTRLGAE
jgi:hypothetical protein